MELIDEYLRLGLRFDRVVPGYVDAYLGDPALREQVAAEPQPDKADLVRQSVELGAAVAAADLEARRKDYLAAHVSALELSARRMAGEEISLVDEVAGYFQVDISPVPTEVYEQVHAELDAVLPGSGAVGDRLRDLRATEVCPPDQVEAAVRRMAEALRERVGAAVGLPADEDIEFTIERDVSWSGFNYYLGNHRSRVAVNADQSHRISQLPVLVAHECYPGHHSEHTRKEMLLVETGAQPEHAIALVNTPSCLMAEGLGDIALSAAIGPGWASWAAEVLEGIGPRFDADLAEELERICRPLNTVRQDAAILLHDQGADPAQVTEYLQRWSLVDQARAEHTVRFLSDPLWRAYISTYVEGERLLRPWLEARPAEQTALQRFQRLLDEPWTPAAIRADLTPPQATS